MNKRTTDIVAYLTYIGLIIALVAGDREASKFHINQALVIWLAATIIGLMSRAPLIGWIIGGVGSIFCAVCWFIGIVNAINGNEKEVPVLGQLRLLR